MAGQNWTTDASGGYLANDVLSKKLRYANTDKFKFRQFVDVKEALGKMSGERVFFDKISRINTSGGTLTESSTIPENGFTIATGEVIVTEYGNSIPYTGKLESLAEFDITNVTQRVLMDDEKAVIDGAVADVFRTTRDKYTITAADTYDYVTTGTATAISTGVLNAYHVKNIVDQLETNLVPTYDGEDYICIASIAMIRGLFDDSDWEDAAKYGDPDRLFAGEVGRYYGCRFVKDTAQMGAAEAVVFGADNVIEAIAVPEEIRAKIPTDYGRSKGLAWYGIMGWAKQWDETDTDAHDHIIHVTSA